MRKVLICLVALVLVSIFTVLGTAHAAYVGIYSLPYVYSSNSDSPAFGGIYLDNVELNLWSSLSFGTQAVGQAAENYSYLEINTNQPVGIYGVGVPLASLGTSPGSYDLRFDAHFRTYDSQAYDSFDAVITQGNYLWSGGSTIGGWSWGGTTVGGIESYDVPPFISTAVNVPTPTNDYFLNVVLQTRVDQTLPSWGRFSDVGVQYNAAPVPEPASLMLLGMGILGLFGLRKKS